MVLWALGKNYEWKEDFAATTERRNPLRRTDTGRNLFGLDVRRWTTVASGQYKVIIHVVVSEILRTDCNIKREFPIINKIVFLPLSCI